MAYEFIKVSLTAYSVTAIIGGLLTFSLVILYPDLFKYMTSLFGASMLAYAFIFFAESACLYIYYYGWHALHYGFKKWVHLTIGLLLNAVGTMLMFLRRGVTFTMNPHGGRGRSLQGNVWHVMQPP
jgi:cytochrome bd-type quinol oxidase subunit 1